MREKDWQQIGAYSEQSPDPEREERRHDGICRPRNDEHERYGNDHANNADDVSLSCIIEQRLP